MPYIKTTFIFNSGRNGWTESWYQDGSQLSGARQPALTVAAKRDNLVGIGGTLEAIRNTTVDKPKKSVVFASGLPIGTDPPNADTPWNGILARVYSTNGDYSRNVYLRCPVDGWINRLANGTFNPNATNALPAFTAFISALTGAAFRFSARDKTGDGGTLRTVTQFEKDGATNRLKANVVGSTIGPGGYVTFSEVTGLGAKAFTKGKHKVKSNTGTVVETETIIPADIFPTSWSPGKLRDYLITYPLVGTGEILRVTKRDTGRAFFVTRGRRSK